LQLWRDLFPSAFHMHERCRSSYSSSIRILKSSEFIRNYRKYSNKR
jgi:hypothetical protein